MHQITIQPSCHYQDWYTSTISTSICVYSIVGVGVPPLSAPEPNRKEKKFENDWNWEIVIWLSRFSRNKVISKQIRIFLLHFHSIQFDLILVSFRFDCFVYILLQSMCTLCRSKIGILLYDLRFSSNKRSLL